MVEQFDLFGGSVDVTPAPPPPPDARHLGSRAQDDAYGCVLRYVPGLPWSPSPQEKAHALARLGIEVRAGETPLQAWVRAMADENGDAWDRDSVAFSPTAVRSFVFALA